MNSSRDRNIMNSDKRGKNMTIEEDMRKEEESGTDESRNIDEPKDILNSAVDFTESESPIPSQASEQEQKEPSPTSAQATRDELETTENDTIDLPETHTDEEKPSSMAKDDDTPEETKSIDAGNGKEVEREETEGEESDEDKESEVGGTEEKSEERQEIDISIEDLTEDLLKERTGGLLLAEDEAEEEILFREEEWIPPLTRWTKIRRYFAQFSLLRGTLIIILLIMGSFTTITFITGQSINDKLNQGLSDLDLGFHAMKNNSFDDASEYFADAESIFREAQAETGIYKYSLLLNLPVTVSSFILAPEILQAANNLPTITDGLIGMSQAYEGLAESLTILKSPEKNPYVLLTSVETAADLQAQVNDVDFYLRELLNAMFFAEQQKESHLQKLESNIGEFFSGHLKEFYNTFSDTAKKLDDMLSLYRISLEVTAGILEELSLSLEIINHVNESNWVLAKTLLPELGIMTEQNFEQLNTLPSEVTNVDDSWFRIPLNSTLKAFSTWLKETSRIIDERPLNAPDLISEALINQVLLELRPIAEVFIPSS